MPRSDQEYIDFDPFLDCDRDVDVRCQQVKIVTTRKPHRCAAADLLDKAHDIPAGALARYESAIVDGEFGSYYCCLPCLEALMVQQEQEEEIDA